MALTHDDLDKIPEIFEDDNQNYKQYLAAAGGNLCSPLSKEGMELQAAYLLKLEENQHPFDVLRRISVNPYAPPKDRISASKVLLEYMGRKVPSGIEVTGADGSAIQLSADALKNLSGDELDTLSALLAKTNGSK